MKSLLFDEIKRFTPKSRISPLSKLNIDIDMTQNTKSGAVSAEPTPLSKPRLLFFMLVLVVSVLTIVSRVITLQLIDFSKYSQLSDRNKNRHVSVLPDRGVIYGSRGVVLARNKPTFALELNTQLCSLSEKGKDLSICRKIMETLGIKYQLNVDAAFKDLSQNKSSIIFGIGLEKDVALMIETQLLEYPGLSVIVYPIRDYVYPVEFSHVLGYVGFDEQSLVPRIIGKSALEKSYEQYLHGVEGLVISEADATGKNFTVISRHDALPGRNLVTSLDIGLQLKSYELLQKAVASKKATGGAVVAQNPKTGEILALVSYPAFDASKMSAGISPSEYADLLEDTGFPFYNRAISAVYPPGSTFKMVVAAGALTEKNITSRTTIFDPGFIQIGSYIFRNWKLEGHGEVDLEKALQVSNDTYFYSLGGGHNEIKGLGIAKLSSWAKKFGFGSATGIDIDNEAKGFMPDGSSRDWYLGDTYITAIGQGDVLATPLQVNNMTAYFANGGILHQPRIVTAVEGIKFFEPVVLAKNLISTQDYVSIREGMKAAVTPGGTGYPLFDFASRHKGIELAGKTGTSEYINAKGDPATHAWFTVFGPYDNATICLTVFLEGGGSGSDDAGPIARDLLDVWFSQQTPAK